MNVQKFDWRPDHRLFTGASGSGKTTLALEHFCKHKARWKFVYDHKGGELAFKLGVPSILDGPGLIDATASGGIVCFNPMREFPGQIREGFAWFCEFVWQIVTGFKGQKLFLCDELQNVLSKGKATPQYQLFLDTGRTYQLDTIGISRAPNRIYCDTREGYTKVFAFRQTDGNATEFLKEAGIDEQSVRTLSPGKYLWRDLDTGESGEGGKAF